MQPKVNYTIVGAFVVVLGIMLIYAVFWLTAGVSSKHYRTYLAFMSESVSGLSDQAPVKYNGVQVGYVDKVTLNPKNPSQVRLVMNIEDDVPIRQDVTATVETQGLTGIAYIGLSGGSPNSPLLTVAPGHEYPVIVTRPSLFLRLDTALRNLTSNLDSITSGLKAILDKPNQEAIEKSLKNIEIVTGTLAKNAERLDHTIKNLDILVENTERASKEFPQLVTDAKQSLQSFKRMSNEMTNAGTEMSMTMRKGRVALNEIVDQLSPQFYTALQNVADLSDELKGLTSELRQNPSMLIRGKQPNPKAPGE